jgi:ankyrin repeat protein
MSDEPLNKKHCDYDSSSSDDSDLKFKFNAFELSYLIKSKNFKNILRYLSNIDLNINESTILNILIKDTFNYSYEQILPIIELLHKESFNFNIISSSGNSAIKCSIYNKHFSLLKALIHIGANVNLSDPLHTAIFQNYVAGFDILLNNNIDINKIDIDGNTPIMIAAYQHNVYFFEKLINLDSINLTNKNKKGHNVLMCSCDNNIPITISNTSIISTLIQKENSNININDVDNENNTALNIVCHLVNDYTNLNILTLLEAGANPNIDNIHNNTPLLNLARCNYIDYVYQIVTSMITLINHGANKKHKNKQNLSIYDLMIDDIKQWYDFCSSYTTSNINQKIFINKNCIICTETQQKMVYFEACQHIIICFDCFKSFEEHNINNQNNIRKCPLCSTHINNYKIVEYI